MAKEEPTAFARFISTVDDGRPHAAITEELSLLVQKMSSEAYSRDQIVKGELTLKLKFSVSPSGVVTVDYDAKRKEPVRKTVPGVMWLAKGGQLVAQDPRQTLLPLREVKRAEDDELREALSGSAPMKEV